METNQMTNLSPSAQAVRVAFKTNQVVSIDGDSLPALAAVLRAAADQVSPEDYASFSGHVEYDQGLEARNDSVREALLAMADELEGR